MPARHVTDLRDRIRLLRVVRVLRLVVYHEARYLQLMILVLQPEFPNRPCEEGQPDRCHEFGFHRDNREPACEIGGVRQDRLGGRAIDHDQIVAVTNLPDPPREPSFLPGWVLQGAAQFQPRRNEVKLTVPPVSDTIQNDVIDVDTPWAAVIPTRRDVILENLNDRRFVRSHVSHILPGPQDAVAQVRLRVQIDSQDAQTVGSRCMGQLEATVVFPTPPFMLVRLTPTAICSILAKPLESLIVTWCAFGNPLSARRPGRSRSSPARSRPLR